MLQLRLPSVQLLYPFTPMLFPFFTKGTAYVSLVLKVIEKASQTALKADFSLTYNAVSVTHSVSRSSSRIGKSESIAKI